MIPASPIACALGQVAGRSDRAVYPCVTGYRESSKQGLSSEYTAGIALVKA